MIDTSGTGSITVYIIVVVVGNVFGSNRHANTDHRSDNHADIEWRGHHHGSHRHSPEIR
jgi:hypothetical protein